MSAASRASFEEHAHELRFFEKEGQDRLMTTVLAKPCGPSWRARNTSAMPPLAILPSSV